CALPILREIPTAADGDVDFDALKENVGPKTAGIMLTNPSTLGVFDRRIEEIAQIVHDAGGLLYYDGANLNAILGKVRPGDMGFDVIHMNRSEEHTSELQSRFDLVCRLLLEKKKQK